MEKSDIFSLIRKRALEALLKRKIESGSPAFLALSEPLYVTPVPDTLLAEIHGKVLSVDWEKRTICFSAPFSEKRLEQNIPLDKVLKVG